MNETILVVDDKSSVRNLIRDYLESEGYRVILAANGREAIYTTRQENPNLVLLDIGMPEMNGFEFIKAVRKEKNVPIILVTARLDETDKVLGLELGADDYITKPFGMKELTARIHAVLRRAGTAPAKAEQITTGAVSMNLLTRMVSVNKKTVDLTPSEFTLLYCLISNPGRVYSRAELLQELQGNTFAGVERTIDVHIRNLRAKIEHEPENPALIETVFGIGYRYSVK